MRKVLLLALLGLPLVAQTPTFDSCGAVAESTTLAGAHSVTAPATIAPGTLLIYGAGGEGVDSNVSVTTPPSGFTLAAANGCAGSNNLCTAMYWKKAVGDEDGTGISITMAGTGAGDSFLGVICAWTTTGTIAASPVVDTDTTPADTGPPHTGPTLDPTGPNQIAVYLTFSNGNITDLAGFGAVTGGTWTERLDSNGDGAGNESRIQFQDAPVTNGVQITGGSVSYTPATPDTWKGAAAIFGLEASGGKKARRPIEF